MKEASGELNMTLVTIIAVALIGTIFYMLWPRISNAINARWEKTEQQGAEQIGS